MRNFVPPLEKFFNPGSITKLLVLAIFLVLGNSISSFVSDINSAKHNEAAVGSSSVSALSASSLPDINQVAKASWFGASPAEATPGNMEATNQLLAEFELKGVSASGDNSFAGAFIKQKDKPVEAYYRIGDMLPGVGVLKQVHADHVIIEHGEFPLKLKFAEIASDASTNAETPKFADASRYRSTRIR